MVHRKRTLRKHKFRGGLDEDKSGISDYGSDDDFSVIPGNDDSVHEFNDDEVSFDLDDNDSSFHLSDLNTSNTSSMGNTTTDTNEFDLNITDSIDDNSNGPLDVLDLDESNSVNTTIDSMGGRKRRYTKKSKKTKKAKTKKAKKTKKSKKTTKKRRQRGGKCFGNGVGANSNDPNYSIYNTNALTLFPYKAT